MNKQKKLFQVKQLSEMNNFDWFAGCFNSYTFY